MELPMARKFQDLMPFSGFRRISEGGCEEACVKLPSDVIDVNGRDSNALGGVTGFFYFRPDEEVGDYLLPFQVSWRIFSTLNGENEKTISNRVNNIGTDGWDKNLPRTQWLMKKGIHSARKLFTGTRHAELPAKAIA
jgi:hypothetical protein